MITTILSIIFFIACLLYVGHLEISFTPFHMVLPRWHLSVSFIFLALFWIFFTYSQQKIGEEIGKEKAYKDIFEKIEEIQKDKVNDIKSDTTTVSDSEISNQK